MEERATKLNILGDDVTTAPAPGPSTLTGLRGGQRV